MYCLFVITWLHVFSTALTEYTADHISDTNYYTIQYRLHSQYKSGEIEALQQKSPERVFQVTTAEKEVYSCVLPEVYNRSQFSLKNYKGLTPAELIQPLYDDRAISLYGSNGYWMYDVAHGRYVLQYHEVKKNNARIEYYLGNFRQDSTNNDAKKFDQLKPPVTTINNVNYPYYPVQYRHGTACDLTGKPRQTTVMYICHENSRNVFHSITEVSTCNYEIIILTSLLCVHPAFAPPTSPEHEIACYSMDPDSDNVRPAALRNLERKASNEFYEQYALELGTSIAATKGAEFSNLINTKRSQVVTPDKYAAGTTFEPKQLLTPPPTSTKFENKKNQFDVMKKSLNEKTVTLQELTQTLTNEDLALMDAFWAGKSCFVGGQGYWRFEICYGSKVTQFHVENQKRVREIVLGEFDPSEHTIWYQKNQKTAIKRDINIIRQVTNLYSDGDYCNEINARRTVEAQFRCLAPSQDMTPSIVLMSLDEPSTCTYKLVLESTLLCEGLQLINSNGYISKTESDNMFDKDNLLKTKHLDSGEVNDIAKNVKELVDDLYEVQRAKRQREWQDEEDAELEEFGEDEDLDNENMEL